MKCPQFDEAICWLVIVTLIARAEPRPHASFKHWRPHLSTAAEDESETQLYAFNQPAMETLPGPEADAMITTPTSQPAYDDDLRIRRLMEELVLKSRLVDGTDVRAALLPKDYGANAMTRQSNGETNAADVYEGEKDSVVKEVQSEQLEVGVVDSAILERFRNEVLHNELQLQSVAQNQVSQREAQLAELSASEDLNFDADQSESSLSAIVMQLSNFYNNTHNDDNQADQSANQSEISLINENHSEILPLEPRIEDVAINRQKQRITETENNPKDDVIENAVKSVKHQPAAWSLVASNDHPVAVLPTVSNASNSFPASTMAASIMAAEEKILEFPTKNAEFLNKIFNNKNASSNASHELFYRQNTPTDDTKAINNERNHISLSGFSNKTFNKFSTGLSDTQHSLLPYNNNFVFIPEPLELLNPMQPLPTANTSLRLSAAQTENANNSAVHLGEIAVKGPESLQVNANTPNKIMAAYEYEENFSEQSEEESDTNTESSRPAITAAAENNVAATSSQATTTTNTTINERNQSTDNSQLEGAAATSPITAVATSTTYQYGDESVEYVEAAIANFLRREVASPVDTGEVDRTKEEQNVAANSNVSATAAEFDRTDVIKSAATNENGNHAAAPVAVGEEVRSTVNCFTEASASASTFAVDGENPTGIMKTRGAWSITRDAETEQLQAGDKNAVDDPEQRQQQPQFGWATTAAGELQWPARAEEDDTNDDGNVGPDSDYAYNERATGTAEMSTIERQSAAILEKDNGPTYGTRAHMADALLVKGHAANGERNRLQGYWTVHGASGESGVDVDADDVDDDDGDSDSDEAIHIMSHLYEMDKTIESDKLSLPPVDDAMKSTDTAPAQPAWRRRQDEDGKVPASPHRADAESEHTNVGEAEITTTNWWHTLSYAEIRKFLNTIFDSATHELYAEIARKSKEIQSDEKEVAAWLRADATVSINDFWSFL